MNFNTEPRDICPACGATGQPKESEAMDFIVFACTACGASVGSRERVNAVRMWDSMNSGYSKFLRREDDS